MCGLIWILVVLTAVLFLWFRPGCVENYRDPIFIDQNQMKYDWYPRTNGSIYGECGSIFSGFPYYDRAY